MPSVLFVCTANRFRSPLAAAIFRHKLDGMGIASSWQVSSAGTWATPGLPVMPGVLEAGQQFGLDLSMHRSVRVSQSLLAQQDLIMVMGAGHKEALLSENPRLSERVYLLSEIAERLVYDIPDALGSKEEILEIVSELSDLIRRGLESICVLATYLHNSGERPG